ncbi:MAG: hypothetical protein K2M50_08030, partial [Treponemataceae bacterium]|nr:hypothetical protein [Treponemataceae bacterium]
APEFVDDGFGGKNGQVTIADMIGGDASAAKAKINFVSWSMIGVQSKFITQGAYDETSKGLDFDSATIGMKSYNKFVGNFLPNCPVYIEIALAETPLDNEKKPKPGADEPIYLAKKNAFNEDVIKLEDGLKDFVSGIFSSPVAYFAQSKNNMGSSNAGPGTRAFLGHLKFGFNTPYINYLTGFNYAKPDVRDAITWTTICSGWDAGYDHVGGFGVFSLGSKVQTVLEEVAGITLDVGFAPNRSADRRGYKYGYWGWADIKKDDLVVDFQTNGMYDDKYLFSDPVEHDFILGAKDAFDVGDGKLSFALQGLLATHQKDSDKIKKDNIEAGGKYTSGFDGSVPDCVGQYFGHSTDVFYRTGSIDGAKNFAGNVRVGYKTDMFGVNLEYRFRGAQASMLYLRENHDDGTFDLSDTLGVLNSQRIGFSGFVNPIDALGINLGVTVEMPLEKMKADDEFVTGYMNNLAPWYLKRHLSENTPLFGVDSGVEMAFKPAVSYTISDNMTVGVYADMNFKNYSIEKDVVGVGEKYGSSDSQFQLKYAGASFSMTPDSDVIKGVNIYYGLDMSNDVRLFNTLVGQVSFPYDITANLAFGIKTENTLSVNPFDSGTNNPFAFAVGVSKKFKAMKKPTLYAQFVFNMDPFKDFGDGQDALNLDRSNVKGIYDAEDRGAVDPVDYYDGEAAVRIGIRWDI